MSYRTVPRRSAVAHAIYGWLNPIPFGFFVAGLIFDIVYARSPDVLWAKGAAWLITIGLLFAVIPRLINLVQVWITFRRTALRADRIDFLLNLAAIVVAVVNAFVHTRDAYAIVPAGIWLSACTVALLSLAHIAMALKYVAPGDVTRA